MLRKRFFKTKDDCEVAFEFEAPEGAAEVALVCESNGWVPIEMKRARKKHVFRTKVRLPKDARFEFRYLVDGQAWFNDDGADAYRPNFFGTHNGVVETHAADA